MTLGWRVGAPPGIDSPFGEFDPFVFGVRLAGLRSALELTQAQLADMSHVARLTVIRWEKGTFTPTLEVMLRIVSTLAFAFGVHAARAGLVSRPEREDLIAAGIKRPLTNEQYFKETSVRIAADNEFYFAVLLFGGYICATAEVWAENFFPSHENTVAKLPEAFESRGKGHYWGFDVGLLMEAAARLGTYKQISRLLRSRADVGQLEASETRLMLEASHSLALSELSEQAYGLTDEEIQLASEGSIRRRRFAVPRIFAGPMIVRRDRGPAASETQDEHEPQSAPRLQSLEHSAKPPAKKRRSDRK